MKKTLFSLGDRDFYGQSNQTLNRPPLPLKSKDNEDVSSPPSLMISEDKKTNDSKLRLVVKSKDWSNGHPHRYDAHVLSKFMRIKSIDIENIAFPCPKKSFTTNPDNLDDVGTNEIRYFEGYCITSNNTISISGQSIALPKMIININSISGDHYLTITTSENHNLLAYETVYLFDETATGFNAHLQTKPFIITSIISDTQFICKTKNIEYSVPIGFAPTHVFTGIYSKREDFCTMVNARISNINMTVSYLANEKQYEITDMLTGENEKRYYLLSDESWNSYCRIRIPPKLYEDVTIFVNNLEQSFNPPRLSSAISISIVDENDAETPITFSDVEYTSTLDFTTAIQTTINTAMGWSLYYNEMKVTYDDTTGKFTFNRYLPFAINFTSNDTSAAFFGFFARMYFPSDSFTSEFETYFRIPKNNCVTHNRFRVIYDTGIKNIRIESLTLNEWKSIKGFTTSTISLPILNEPLFADNYMFGQLAIRKMNKYNYVSTSNILEHLNPPDHIKMRFTNIPNTIKTKCECKDFDSSSSFMAKFMRNSSNDYYSICYTPSSLDLTGVSLEYLSIEIVNTDDSPFNTDGYNHEIILKLEFF